MNTSDLQIIAVDGVIIFPTATPMFVSQRISLSQISVLVR